MPEDVNKYLPLSKPKIGISGKTGSWRIFAPEINYEKCVKCHICVVVCPEASILLEDDRPKIDYDYCKGCGVCARECPVGAITMRRER
ncbi:MAG: ferredoxin [Thermoplasmata archaeon]|nr:MAG: ferredoxin [Thermoplasmata archaeon]